MHKVKPRKGNVVVITMFCLILIMFVAALVLDVGLVEIPEGRFQTASSNTTELVAETATETATENELAVAPANEDNQGSGIRAQQEDDADGSNEGQQTETTQDLSLIHI